MLLRLKKLYVSCIDAYWMSRLPLFISFPRTGSEWINSVMELYFDRPRLRKSRATFMDEKRKDWMWFHDHDMELKVKHDNTFYLYREPINTIFSLVAYNIKTKVQSFMPIDISRVQDVTEEQVRFYCSCYRDNLLKWLLGKQKSRVFIKYEIMKAAPQNEFEKICRFFDKPFDQGRMAECFNAVKKEDFILKSDQGTGGGLRKDMLSAQYEKDRRCFKDTWGELVNRTVIVPQLESYF